MRSARRWPLQDRRRACAADGCVAKPVVGCSMTHQSVPLLLCQAPLLSRHRALPVLLLTIPGLNTHTCACSFRPPCKLIATIVHCLCQTHELAPISIPLIHKQEQNSDDVDSVMLQYVVFWRRSHLKQDCHQESEPERANTYPSQHDA